MGTNVTFTDFATVVNADWAQNVNDFVNYHTAKVVMVRKPNSTTDWYVFAPDGTQVSTVGTTTSGLQEAINYALANGYGLDVIGGATSKDPGGIDHGFIWCSTGVVFPPMRTTFIHMEGVHLIFPEAVGSSPGVTFNSCMEVTVDMRACEIVYYGTSSALRFAPVAVTPVDPQVAIGDSEFAIGSVVTVANTAGTNTPYVVHMDCTQGPIQGAKFSFAELNGNGAVGQPACGIFGVIVQAAATGSGFLGNVIEARHIHQVTTAGVQVGLSQTNQSTMYGNIWKIPLIQTAGANATGFNSYGSGDVVDIGDIDSAYSGYLAGVLLEPGSMSNIVRAGRIAGATVQAVTDSGNNNDVIANGISWKPSAGVNLGSNNQSIPNNTWTKVAFNTEEWDTGNHYDNAAYRWTPGTTGQAEIVANVAWNAPTAGSAYFTAIYKNGSAIKQARIVPSAAVGGQSIPIIATIPVLATTDYFEVWVFQNSGSATLLDGANVDSWATFKMVS